LRFVPTSEPWYEGVIIETPPGVSLGQW
jgi:hypothetical protein